EMFSYIVESCRRGRLELEDKIQGIDRMPEADDTQVGDPLIRPFPPLKGRPVKDSFFLDERNEPMMILSLHSPSQTLQRFFATPLQHIESYAVGGGSRWTIYDSPVYAAFQQWPDAHRVGWDGWCGHLIRDRNSMAGRRNGEPPIRASARWCLRPSKTRGRCLTQTGRFGTTGRASIRTGSRTISFGCAA